MLKLSTCEEKSLIIPNRLPSPARNTNRAGWLLGLQVQWDLALPAIHPRRPTVHRQTPGPGAFGVLLGKPAKSGYNCTYTKKYKMFRIIWSNRKWLLVYEVQPRRMTGELMLCWGRWDTAGTCTGGVTLPRYINFVTVMERLVVFHGRFKITCYIKLLLVIFHFSLDVLEGVLLFYKENVAGFGCLHWQPKRLSSTVTQQVADTTEIRYLF